MYFTEFVNGIGRRFIRGDAQRDYRTGQYRVPTTDRTKWVSTWKEFKAAGGAVCFEDDQSRIELLLPEPYKFSIQFGDDMSPEMRDQTFELAR